MLQVGLTYIGKYREFGGIYSQQFLQPWTPFVPTPTGAPTGAPAYLPETFYFREQCLALAYRRHGGKQTFEAKATTLNYRNSLLETKIAAANAQERRARKSYLESRLMSSGSQLDVDGIERDPEFPPDLAREIRHFIKGDEPESDTNVLPDRPLTYILKDTALYLAQRTRKEAILHEIRDLTPNLWPHYNLGKFLKCTAFEKFVHAEPLQIDESLRSHAATAARLVLDEAQDRERMEEAVLATLKSNWDNHFARDTLDIGQEDYLSNGMAWVIDQGVFQVTGTTRSRLLKARKIAEDYLGVFSAAEAAKRRKRAEEEEKKGRVRQARRSALIAEIEKLPRIASQILPITNTTDSVILQYYNDFLAPANENCDHHLTWCLRGTVSDILNRCRVLANMEKLDSELKLWIPNYHDANSLTTENARNAYDQFIRAAMWFKMPHSARKIYRIELLSRALEECVPTFDLHTALPESLDFYFEFIEDTSHLSPFPLCNAGASCSDDSRLFRREDLQLPVVPSLNAALHGIFRFESVRLSRVWHVTLAVRKSHIEQEWDPKAVIRIDGANFEEAIQHKDTDFQELAHHWIYDPTYPSASEISKIINHTREKLEKAYREDVISNSIRNNPRFQAMFEDAYERHDWLVNSFYMPLIYRCCPEFVDYISGNSTTTIDKVVEVLIDIIGSVKRGSIADRAFTPELPEDLVVEFHVNQTSLLISIFALSFHQSAIPLQIQSKILGKFKTFKIDTYKGRPVEIVDEFAAESSSPMLAALMQSIDSVEALAEDIRSKLQALA
ncbi:hypothetical protein HK104_008751 [Borealophlyctis nickersoniae]|nr:hypothetical protein HK104_008751 [Borealophlyctis nickersoniae]